MQIVTKDDDSSPYYTSGSTRHRSSVGDRRPAQATSTGTKRHRLAIESTGNPFEIFAHSVADTGPRSTASSMWPLLFARLVVQPTDVFPGSTELIGRGDWISHVSTLPSHQYRPLDDSIIAQQGSWLQTDQAVNNVPPFPDLPKVDFPEQPLDHPPLVVGRRMLIHQIPPPALRKSARVREAQACFCPDPRCFVRDKKTGQRHPRRFTRPDSLLRHNKEKHGALVPGHYICLVCDDRYGRSTRKDRVIQHCRLRHPQIDASPCDSCPSVDLLGYHTAIRQHLLQDPAHAIDPRVGTQARLRPYEFVSLPANAALLTAPYPASLSDGSASSFSGNASFLSSPLTSAASAAHAGMASGTPATSPPPTEAEEVFDEHDYYSDGEYHHEDGVYGKEAGDAGGPW